MISILLTSLALVLSLSTFSQVKDVDGNEYRTVKIGEQEWMAENLNVSHFRNGDEIPQAKTAEEWEKAEQDEQPMWCYKDFDPELGETYGKLYNFYCIADDRGIAPEGWEVPSKRDWENLTDTQGGVESAGEKLKNDAGWGDGNGNGTNESGFSALPGGQCNAHGYHSFHGSYGMWWSSTEENIVKAWCIMLNMIDDTVSLCGEAKNYGLSLRCVRVR